MPVWTVVYTWRDNNGRIAEHKVNAGEGANFSGVAAFAAALAGLLEPLSDASLLGFAISQDFPTLPPPAPGPGSDVKRYATLFYTNDDTTSSIRVPSVAGVLAETVGPYAGFRITRERLEVLGLLTLVDSIPAGTLDPVGRPYGTTFVVGSLSREQSP